MSRRRAHAKYWTAEKGSRSVCVDDDPIEVLIRRSKRQQQRGDQRAAVVLLQRACSMDEWRARTFTLLGALLYDLGRSDEAERAFLHARWLRRRAGEMSRAEVTMRLLDRVRAPRAAP